MKTAQPQTLLRLLDVETEWSHFTVVLHREAGRFMARYWNTPSRFVSGSHSEVADAVSGEDAGSVLARALAHIELIDGPILDVCDNALSARLPGPPPHALTA